MKHLVSKFICFNFIFNLYIIYYNDVSSIESSIAVVYTSFLDCVRRQYSNYTIGNPDGDPSKFFRVDGNITLGENIADHGGLKIAEIAYERWLSTQPNGKQDVVLPALENFRYLDLYVSQKIYDVSM